MAISLSGCTPSVGANDGEGGTGSASSSAASKTSTSSGALELVPCVVEDDFSKFDQDEWTNIGNVDGADGEVRLTVKGRSVAYLAARQSGPFDDCYLTIRLGEPSMPTQAGIKPLVGFFSPGHEVDVQYDFDDEQIIWGTNMSNTTIGEVGAKPDLLGVVLHEGQILFFYQRDHESWQLTGSLARPDWLDERDAHAAFGLFGPLSSSMGFDDLDVVPITFHDLGA